MDPTIMKKKHQFLSSSRNTLILLILCISVVAMVSCERNSQALQPVTLPMGYVANIQFSPFYVAKELEYFQSAGFDVTFDYRWETDGIQLVAAGELPFTIASGDQVIQARSQGLPVKAIAAWYQEYPVAIISSEDFSLDKPEDLRNLKIGIPETFGASYIGLRALLKAGNLTENDIDLQVIGYTQLALLTSGQIDAAVVYSNNEPVVLSQQGYGFNTLYVSDYSDIVSAVLVSSDTYISENPEIVSSFVNAFLQGLSDVMSEPDTAFEISTGYVEGLEDNKDTQRAVLDASMEIWKTEYPGQMNEAAWANAQNIMFQAGLIEKLLPHEQFYTNEFIP
jgi:NitT/TauT family transport system substrate-binding protein